MVVASSNRKRMRCFRCLWIGSLLVACLLTVAVFLLHSPIMIGYHWRMPNTNPSDSHIVLLNISSNRHLLQLSSLSITTVAMLRNQADEQNDDLKMQTTTTSVKQTTISSNTVFIKRNQYNWVIFEDFCIKRYPALKLLIIVHTAIEHFSRRQIYRDMYGDQFYEEQGAAMLFVLGVSADETRNKRILEESSIYHDIIQEDFLDVYRNLTWKALAWLRFVSENCSNVQYILKIDDDVIFDLFGVINYLGINSNRTIPIDDDRLIICGLFDKASLFPQRNRSLKWFVTKEEYELDYYHPYCRGIQYIVTPSTAKNIFNAAIGEKYFWIDDYFITGHLAHKINVTFDDIRSLQAGEKQLLNRKALFWWIIDGNIKEGKKVWHRLRTRYEIDQLLEKFEVEHQKIFYETLKRIAWYP